MAERIKTNYPGVYYRESVRATGKGKEKVFYILYKRDGKLHEEKAGRQHQDNMTAAKAATIRGELIEGKRLSRKEIRSQFKAAKQAENDRWTIDKLWAVYQNSRSQGPSLIADQGRYNKHIKKVFGDKEPKEIAPLEVDRLRLKLSKTLAPQTVKHVLNLLTWIINYGVKNQLCQGISFHIKKPTVNNTKTEYLTQDQIKNLLETIERDPNYHVGNLMKLALCTGMRKGELLNLQWRDIEFDRGFITIRDPKGGKDQIIPMSDSAKAVLEAHPKENPKWVFPGKDGEKRVTIDAAARKIKKAAKLPEDFRPLHGLRHTYASMLASSGEVDMYVLQRLLTHKDPRMTQRYAHLRDATLRKASNVAGDLLAKAIIGTKERNLKAVTSKKKD